MHPQQIRSGRTYFNHGRGTKRRTVVEIDNGRLEKRVCYETGNGERTWTSLREFAAWAAGEVPEEGRWEWPLLAQQRIWPDAPGQFGTPRKHDIHTGIDLYCPLGTRVVAVEAGMVVGVENFTGPAAGSPWWNDTQALLVEGQSGVVVYGEMAPEPELTPGVHVEAGQHIGTVTTSVLKTDKGRPMTMLHVELMAPGTHETLWWPLDREQPPMLLDPTAKLFAAGHPLWQYDFAGLSWPASI